MDKAKKTKKDKEAQEEIDKALDALTPEKTSEEKAEDSEESTVNSKEEEGKIDNSEQLKVKSKRDRSEESIVKSEEVEDQEKTGKKEKEEQKDKKESEKKFAGPLELIKRSFSTLFKNFGVILGVYLIALGFQTAFGVFSLGAIFVSLINNLGSFDFQRQIILIAIIAVLALLVGFLYGLSQLAIMIIVKYKDEKVGVLEAYARALPKFLPYYFVIVLAILITWGGTVLLIVPGILFGIWFALSPMVVIFDDLKGMNALLKSREYIKHRLLGYVWRHIVLGIVVVLIGALFGVLSASLAAGVGSDQLNFITRIAGNLASVLFVPLTFIFSSHTFLALKESKTEEEVDIEGKSKVVYIIFAVLGLISLIAIPILALNFKVPTSLPINF